jgi:hypothetical protein
LLEEVRGEQLAFSMMASPSLMVLTLQTAAGALPPMPTMT